MSSNNNTYKKGDSVPPESGAIPPNELTPVLKKLSPKLFEASVKFYDADKELEQSDRVAIASDLRSVVLKTSFFGYGSAILGFLGPTAFQKIQTGAAIVAIHRPVLSLVIGLSTLFVANRVSAKNLFRSKAQQLENRGLYRQVDVWRAMDSHQANLFYMYYKWTADNPSFVIGDPRSFTEKNLHQVHSVHQNRPGQGLSENPYAREGGLDSSTSHWDKVRQSNGFSASGTPSSKSDTEDFDEVKR